MLKKSIFLALVLGLNLSAFADYYQNQDASPSNDSYYSSDSQPNNTRSTSNVSDQELTKKINDKIGPGWFTKGYDQVNFQVNNGFVTLQGSVKTQEDKEKVEKIVRDIDGVKGVNSRIAVQDQNPSDRQQKQFSQDKAATSADDQLNKKIRDNVSRGWLWNSYTDVFLNTANGTVTIEGTVDSMKDQQKLVNEIQKVDGVRNVRSNLTIKNS